MKDVFYDCVIIGGGPSGVACGITLCKENKTCCIIDTKSFPRDKNCGGLITSKTYRLLLSLVSEDELKKAICQQSNHLQFYNGTEQIANVNTDCLFSFVNRKSFDHMLIQKFVSLGGVLLDGQNNYRMEPESNTVYLGDARHTAIHYTSIIIADGANSKTATEINHKKLKLGFCVETHIKKSKTTLEDAVAVYFGIVKNGYAWVFPKGDTFCIGLGGVFDKSLDYTALLRRFISQFTGEHDYRVVGAFVPYGHTQRKLTDGKNRLIVGDAAGLVDPIYGEGIYFAILSGIHAAHSVANHKKDMCRAYVSRIKPTIKLIRQGYRMQRIFFSRMIQKIFVRYAKGSHGFINFYARHQISDYDYSYAQILKMILDYKKLKRGKSKA